MRYNHDLKIFTRVVKSMAGKFKADPLQNSEDIEQECWIKLVEVKPELDKVKPEEVTKFAHVIIKNHVASIVSKSKVRAHLNHKLQCSISSPLDGEDAPSMEELADRQILKLDRYIPQHRLSAFEITAYRKLVGELLAWSNGQTGTARKLVKEMVAPSDETLGRWYEMTKRHPVYKTFETIPPSSFSEIFGCSKLTIFRTMEKLRRHLESRGYDRSYLNMN